MTVFNVAGLLREPPGAARVHLLRDHYRTLGPDVELAGPLDGEIRLSRTNRGVLVRGRLTASLRRVCGRCLEPFVDEVTVDLIEEFVPSVDPVSGAALANPAGDETTHAINAHHEVDLGGVLREELVLTEPLTPLCRRDCAGLCSVCGLPAQEGDHRHGDDEIDPRMAALGRLLEAGDRPEE